jgi:hypothetical protein
MPCAYNVAMAFIEAKSHLVQYSSDSTHWKWGDFMTLEYVN